jgi:hypothetical protein
MYGYYTCEKCECTLEYKKPYGEEFPEQIKKGCQSDSGKKTCTFKRDLGHSPVVFDVAPGRTGNARNGYKSSIAGYEPGKFSPPRRESQSMFDSKTGQA